MNDPKGPGSVFYATCAAFFLVLFYAAFGGYVLQSCVSGPSAQERTVETWNRITADGRVTKAEADEMALVLQDRDETNWPLAIGQTLAALVAALTGVGVARRHMQAALGGLQEDVDVAHERLDVRESVRPAERDVKIPPRPRPKVRVTKH